MELKKNKSTLAALATIGVTAVAAGATAFIKIREHRRERREQEALSADTHQLSAEQMMVYNEAISAFIALNERIYELRRQREQLQPLISRLAGVGPKPEPTAADVEETSEIAQLAQHIERFLTTQVPFINACLATISTDEMTYADCVRGPVGELFDASLDEEPTGAEVTPTTRVRYVLRMGYYFPDSTIAPLPQKSLVVVAD